MNDFYITLFCFTLLHCCLFFFDTIFRSCSHVPYLYLMKKTGLEIQPFRIIWFTTAFNRLLQKWGSVRKKLQLAWFTTGTWFAVVLLPFALWLILHSLFQVLKQIIREEKDKSVGGVLLEPMVPGVNFPISDLGYYMVTLIIISVFHEIGHAVSAVREDIHITGVGLVLLFIVPLAYVQMEQLELLPPAKQLHILCAGVWHNIVLAVTAALAVSMLPWLLYPLYDFGTGVQVQNIAQESPLLGQAGLLKKDRIIRLNQCLVSNKADWQDCLVQAVREPTPGFCIHSEFIKENDETKPAKHLADGAVKCCNSSSPRHLCFEYLEMETEPLELPQHSCLNVRNVIEASSEICHKSSIDTKAGSAYSLALECSFGYHCFRPSLANSTKLVIIKRSFGKKVLFLGHPAEIYHTIQVSDFISIYNLFPSSIPDMIVHLGQFITMLSAGLAIVNIIPCFNFDGQHIIKVLMDILLSKKIQHSSIRHAIALCITIVGTIILILYMIAVLWTML
ncbi:membrane-bound transcription factor site-2 protease [Lycorma delicatula]|uniref:membrane-bound transcription factor site-2 protease n=1 Tax=Lycorma delicatula TaxID=130591 RepID=UPI003F5184A0